MKKITEFRYTSDSNITQMICRVGEHEQITRWIYGTDDPIGGEGIARADLVRKKEYPGEIESTYLTYNRLSQLKKLTDQNGTIHNYSYDGLGRIIHDTVTVLGEDINGDVRTILNYYAPRGELRSVVSIGGADQHLNTVQFTYNGFGQLVEEQQEHHGGMLPETPKIEYSYAQPEIGSNSLRILSIKYPSGRILKYEYSNVIDEAFGRISGVVDITDSEEPRILAEYQYLGAQSIVKIYYPSPDLTLDGVSEQGNLRNDGGDPYKLFDRFGRPEEIIWKSHGEVVSNIRFGYDMTGRKQWREDSYAAPTSLVDEYYTRDKLYNLCELKRGRLNINRTDIGGEAVRTEKWNLDEVGNWLLYKNASVGSPELTEVRQHNSANEIQFINGDNSTTKYLPSGEMSIIPSGKQPSLPVQSNRLKLIWDAWGQLHQIRDSDDDTLIDEFEYDGMGRRIVHKVNELVNDIYYSDKYQIIQENGSGAENYKHEYVWGVCGIDDLIVRSSESPLQSNQDIYPISDNKNIVAITDASGAILERYAYSAFGVPEVLSPMYIPIPGNISQYDWQVLYCKYFYDRQSQLYHVRARTYHPELGRWLSRDKKGERVDINLYAYVRNQPIDVSDPSGLDPLETLLEWLKNPLDISSDFEMDDIANERENKRLADVRELIKQGKAKCDNYPPSKPCIDADGESVPDTYTDRARNICKRFIDVYVEANDIGGFVSKAVICVADCLSADEKATQTEPCCSKRNAERLNSHLRCYRDCGFLPDPSKGTLGVPGFESWNLGFTEMVPDWLREAGPGLLWPPIF